VESSAKRNESPEDERRMTELSSCRPPISESFKQISLPKTPEDNPVLAGGSPIPFFLVLLFWMKENQPLSFWGYIG